MRLSLLVAVLLLGLPAACTVAEPASQGPGSPPAVEAARLVSLGAGVTEVVYALDRGAGVVATDASSKVPDQAASKAVLGYYRRVSAEGILSKAPTLVLASEGTGPPTTLEQLEAAGVAVHTVPAVVSMDDARARMRTLGKLLDASDKAEALVAAMDADLAQVQGALDGRPVPRVLFIYARGGGTLMAAGRDTSAQTMIQAAGGQLAAPDHEGFRPLTSEAVVAAAPDVVLVTRGGMEALGGVEGVLAAPGLAATPAGRDRRVVAMDDNLLLDMGPRTGAAVRVLAGYLHPELAL